MKKRSRHAKRSSARKTSRHTTRKPTSSSFIFPFSLRRIVFITTCIALFVVALVFVKGQGIQSVAGINITKGLFVQATVTMPQIQDAISYNIYYKEEKDNTYKNAVRDIPPTVTEYTISYLSKNTEYIYKVSAVNSDGAEFWFSEEKPLDSLQPM